jgi:hypothetical protein
MKITSNINAVIGQFGKLRAAIPLAAQRALSPSHHPWDALAKQRALVLLTGLAQSDEERQAVPRFIESIVEAATDEGKLVLAMGPVGEAGRAQVTSGLAEALETGRPYNRRDLLAAIRQWIETPREEGGKRTDAHDIRNPDEVAQFIEFLISTAPHNLIGERAQAREGLRFHVLRWLQQETGLPADLVQHWLLAVLAAWKDMVRQHFPHFFKEELRKAVKPSTE